MPFHCHQVWSGQTRTNHDPQNAIDFNRANDFGDHVLASAPGTVSLVSTASGYGRYIKINHGGLHVTLYAHLNAVLVSIGHVGESGNVTGPHLHYELIVDGNDVRIRFHGNLAFYFGTRSYERTVGCDPSDRIFATGARQRLPKTFANFVCKISLHPARCCPCPTIRRHTN